jgi:hypothetical protein
MAFQAFQGSGFQADAFASASLPDPALNRCKSSMWKRVGRRHRYGALILVPAILTAGTTAVTGTLSATLPALSVSAAGTSEYLGTQAHTLPALTFAATGTVERLGSLATTLPAVTLAATGTVPQPGGDLALTLGPVTLAAAGTSEYLAPLAVTLPPVTLSAAGTAGAPPPTVGLQFFRPTRPQREGRRHQWGVTQLRSPLPGSSNLTVTLPPVTLSAAGTFASVPFAYQQLPRGIKVTALARAVAWENRGRASLVRIGYTAIPVPPTADVSFQVPRLALAATGTVANPVTGALGVLLPALTAVHTGGVTDNGGEILASLPVPVLAASGTVIPNFNGDLFLTMPELVLATNSPSPIIGALAVTLPPLELDVVASAVATSVVGQLAVTLPQLVTVYDGAVADQPGTVDLTLPAVALAATGAYVPAPITGALAHTLPALTVYLGRERNVAYSFEDLSAARYTSTDASAARYTFDDTSEARYRHEEN